MAKRSEKSFKTRWNNICFYGYEIYLIHIHNFRTRIGVTFNSWIHGFIHKEIGKTKGFSPRHDDILMFTKNRRNFYLT